MKKSILIIILILYSLQIYSQKEQKKIISSLDSLISINDIKNATNLITLINKDTLNFTLTQKAKYYYLLGELMDKKDEEGKAYTYFKKSSEYYNKVNTDKEELMNVYYKIFSLLISRKNLKHDAEKYLDKVYKYAIQAKDTNYLIKAYRGKAMLNYNPKNFKKSLNYYNQIIAISQKQNDIQNLAQAYNNKAGIFVSYFTNSDSARYFYSKSNKEYKKLKKYNEEFATSLNIGILYLKEHNYKEALKWFQKIDTIPISKYKKNYKRLLYNKMASAYENSNDYKNALLYFKKYSQYKDSVNVEKQNVAISKIETKYKALQKEKENLQLKAEKKQQKYIILGVTGIFISTLIAGLLLYFNLKHKKENLEKEKQLAETEKEIEKQKVDTLIKEQEILAMDAMIEGQEKERLRLAEDLHDNIGSSIATLKMHFDRYKNIEEKENPERSLALENSSMILDETYQKVRYLAHTNHAAVMEEQGLIASLKLLVQKLSDAKNLQVELNHFGFGRKLNSKLELNIFRIIQEILTNIIKHANATEINIDINLFDDILTIIIEDNGIGFDVEKTLDRKSGGMGLQNLINRVERENGKFSLDSQIGNGTSIVIEIPINNVI